MSEEIYFSAGAPSGDNTFDAAAFNQRFAEITAQDAAVPAGSGKKPKKKKKRIFVKILCALLVLALLLTGTAAAAIVYVTKDYTPKKLEDNPYCSEADLMHAAGVTNILLMGIDTKYVNTRSRSDSMLLLTVDGRHGKIKITSFMRDMYVPVPGHGTTKLTHACAYAGPQLTVDTIEADFGIRIDGYVKISYKIFVDIVNGVGGITVPEISEVESRALAKEGVNIAPGKNIHLNGHEALNYCRIRKGQSDFHRTARQREAFELIVKQALKTNPLTLLKLARAVASEAESSIEKSQLAMLALKALPCLKNGLEQHRVPADGTWDYGTRDGMSVLLVDVEKNKAYLKEWLY